MSMEKRGVTEDEGEAPKTKEAQDCAKPKCCGQQACGTDTMSKMAEAIADDTVKPYKVVPTKQ